MARSRGSALPAFLATVVAVAAAVHLVPYWDFALPLPERVARSSSVVTRRAEPVDAEVVGAGDGDAALVRLEENIKLQIEKAQADGNPDRLRDLARLLVLAKTAEGIVLKEGATDASSTVKSAVAESLASFVGKDDYDFNDVASEVKVRTVSAATKLRSKAGSAVAALDDVYLEDIANEMALASQAAVARFTGKESYEFGDISNEIDTRAKTAIASFTGKEDYQFGDITKEALKRGGSAVKDFIGKDEYQFGDITKTVFKNIFGKGDEKK